MSAWPDKILIGHVWFKLVGFAAADRHKHELDTGDTGWCDYEGQRLFYCTDESPPMQADTILHEITHAIHKYFGLVDQHFDFPAGMTAERVVRLTATGICMVFSANADFRRVFMSAIAPGTKTPFPILT